MWPLYLLFNKILRAEEGQEEVGDAVVEFCPFEQSSRDVKCHFVQVPHINQLFSWDCGLACVLMVLRTIGIGNCNIQGLADLCCSTSIWTVDLAYLLQKFSVRFSYFTVTFGVNPNYSVETFYKEQLPADLVRVDMLFQKALGAGIDIQCRSVSGEELSCLLLSGKYIAIALVDQYKLSQSRMDGVFASRFYGNNLGYTGHYVVICGYDAGADEFEIRDPASSRKHDRISSECLEEARKSFGTDEDLLLISLERSKKQNSSSISHAPHVNNDS
ncbi:Guanylate_cyc_2 domain-containing protein [Cephalotus follicularis]|uniref:Guanylate_cyc_2 domain-containing protein n=1 Tax=Cephalotus follicularis TaxID=3775 RepID=A0A1Q3AMA7_CEPFO|nr:Guanylate_cyc_2 domain-containing protein [Cephalotus follicularis]